MNDNLKAFSKGLGTGVDPIGTILGYLGLNGGIGHLCEESYRNPATTMKEGDKLYDAKDRLRVLRKVKKRLPEEKQPDDLGHLITQAESDVDTSRLPDVEHTRSETVYNTLGKVTGVGLVVGTYALVPFIAMVAHVYGGIGMPVLQSIHRAGNRRLSYKLIRDRDEMAEAWRKNHEEYFHPNQTKLPGTE